MGGAHRVFFLSDNELKKTGAGRAAKTHFISICKVSRIGKSLTPVQFTLVLVIFLLDGLYTIKSLCAVKVVLIRL